MQCRLSLGDGSIQRLLPVIGRNSFKIVFTCKDNRTMWRRFIFIFSGGIYHVSSEFLTIQLYEFHRDELPYTQKITLHNSWPCKDMLLLLSSKLRFLPDSLLLHSGFNAPRSAEVGSESIQPAAIAKRSLDCFAWGAFSFWPSMLNLITFHASFF